MKHPVTAFGSVCNGDAEEKRNLGRDTQDRGREGQRTQRIGIHKDYRKVCYPRRIDFAANAEL